MNMITKMIIMAVKVISSNVCNGHIGFNGNNDCNVIPISTVMVATSISFSILFVMAIIVVMN